jgi:hypothetical protein
MSKLARTVLVAIVAGMGWAVVIGYLWKTYRDPLTGFGLQGYLGYVGFHALLGGGIGVAICRRWLLLASLLIGLALFLALPLPSKRGVDLRIENASGKPAEVHITRRDRNNRTLKIFVESGQRFLYRTAPGEYRETIPLLIKHGAAELSVTVADLRTNEVVITRGEIHLSGVQQK